MLQVLLVEDSETDRKILEHVLNSKGNEFDVSCALNADEAIELVRKQHPDCILLDYHLPGKSGAWFYEKLKFEYGGSPPPVVMITADSSQKVSVDSLKLGISDFISKSALPTEDVGALIRRLVSAWKDARLAAQQGLSVRLDSLSQLVATTAHEICNPAAAARMTLASVAAVLTMRTHAWGPEAKKLKEQLLLADEALARIGAVIRNLEVQTGVAAGYDERLSLDEATQIGCKNVVATEKFSCRFTLQLNAPRHFDADRAQIVQLVSDLLQNAAEAAGPEGQVTVTCSQEEGHVLLKIEDDGPGVPLELRACIFEPLFSSVQSGKRTTSACSLFSESAHVGMGLARVSSILLRHGGSITVGVSSLGGALFEVCLPTAPALPPTSMGA